MRAAEAELRRELINLLTIVNEQIERTRTHLQEQHALEHSLTGAAPVELTEDELFSRVDMNGRYILFPIYETKAQILHALVLLKGE